MTGQDPISTIQLDDETAENLLFPPYGATEDEMIEFFAEAIRKVCEADPTAREYLQQRLASGDY